MSKRQKPRGNHPCWDMSPEPEWSTLAKYQGKWVLSLQKEEARPHLAPGPCGLIPESCDNHGTQQLPLHICALQLEFKRVRKIYMVEPPPYCRWGQLLRVSPYISLLIHWSLRCSLVLLIVYLSYHPSILPCPQEKRLSPLSHSPRHILETMCQCM